MHNNMYGIKLNIDSKRKEYIAIQLLLFRFNNMLF